MKIKKLTLRACTVTAVIMILIAVLPVMQALAASSGPFNAGAGTDVTGIGTVSLDNPGNITSYWLTLRDCNVPVTATTHYLKAPNMASLSRLAQRSMA